MVMADITSNFEKFTVRFIMALERYPVYLTILHSLTKTLFPAHNKYTPAP